MREIKFRAWSKERKCMIHDVQKEYDCSIGAEDCFGVYLNQECGYGRAGSSIYEVNQYTGLKDCNKKDIYEGDIVKKYTRSDWVVIWGSISNGFVLEANGNHLILDGTEEIIGNIYENPEILEK